jgi:hypothetical protein
MSRLAKAIRETLSAVHAPGVQLPPWKIETRDGGKDSARGLSVGIMGGCVVEHDHDSGDNGDACVLTEFSVVWNNNSRLPATHTENRDTIATSRALVAAFNFMARHGEEILRLLGDETTPPAQEKPR